MSGNGRNIAVENRGLQGNFFTCGYRAVFVKVFSMFDDLEPQKKTVKLRNLEPMSVDELLVYVGEMKAEITRTEAEITKKKAYASAASSFFKT
jgi:uncharacterized small protein (DUF1192 family)